MNSVSLIGRFTKDPELRYTPTGTAVCNFTLAVRNPFNPDGEADFPQCVAWGNGAELIADKHVKGNMIGVDGRIQTRSYENNDGQMVYVTEVNVNAIHLIQTKDYVENANNNGNNRGNANNRNNGNGNKGNKNNSKGNGRGKGQF